MGTFGKILILKNLIITIIVLTEGKTVDILTSAGLPSSLEDEEILRILGQNKSQAFSENFTFVELVGSLRNHTEIIQDNLSQKILCCVYFYVNKISINV